MVPPMSQPIRKDRFSEAAEKTAAAERAIQQVIDAKEKAREKAKPKQDNEKGGKKPAMQAGARKYPEPPLPAAASRPSPARKPSCDSRRCTTRRITRDRRS